jgi:formylglycine-generating enzyme required for sulfatase activity
MVCLCSEQYDSSPWCVGEVAIAVRDGKTVIPIQLAKTASGIKTDPLPLLLQTKQAIKVANAVNPSRELLAEVKLRMLATLQKKLNWRDLQHWDKSLAPYPGLPAFDTHQAAVFFGRDKAIEAVVERLAGLALRRKAFLLVLGASGYGKSSLVRAGVLPRLLGGGEGRWTVLPPFTPGDEPFKELAKAVVDSCGVVDASDPLCSLQELQRKTNAPVVLVIDQFEELLTAGPEGEPDQCEEFQMFLQKLLCVRKAGLIVLATMRTDFFPTLQRRWPVLTNMASTYPLGPIEPEDFGELITGPAKRATLTLEPGLETRLVNESGGRDALPLLAFTLEKLWKARNGRVLTLNAYEALGGVAGAVSTRAKECWDPQTSSEEVRLALRKTFIDHLVSLSDEGRVVKRSAQLDDLPLASRAILERMVDDRLLVLKEGTVEIAHEALLRTWEPLVKWIEEGKEELLQCLRVKRLSDDIKPEAPERRRRQVLDQLASLAAAGGSEERAVQKEATDPLTQLLANGKGPLADQEDAAQVLALIGAEEPLRKCLANTEAPVALRRRAAECMGLLANRCVDREQRLRIAQELEGWLRIQPLDVLVVDDAGWAEHDRRLPILQGASRGQQLAIKAELPLLGSDLVQPVPMLTLTAHVEGDGLRVITDVVDVPVWRLPLPDGEDLEMVLVPGGIQKIGSPEAEAGRDCYAEPQRSVRLASFAMARFPISQAQWASVARLKMDVQSQTRSTGTYKDYSLWGRYALPGGLAIESVSWLNCLEWLKLFNSWISENWDKMGGLGAIPLLAFPDEIQWEVACRAGSSYPFHFGSTLDPEWANYDGTEAYGPGGRKGRFQRQPSPIGFFGLANRWGLADMHGNCLEWCSDIWQPNPIEKGPQKRERALNTQTYDSSGMRVLRPLRGGCWNGYPDDCRAACRKHANAGEENTIVGFRPCCNFSNHHLS